MHRTNYGLYHDNIDKKSSVQLFLATLIVFGFENGPVTLNLTICALFIADQCRAMCGLLRVVRQFYGVNKSGFTTFTSLQFMAKNNIFT